MKVQKQLLNRNNMIQKIEIYLKIVQKLYEVNFLAENTTIFILFLFKSDFLI